MLLDKIHKLYAPDGDGGGGGSLSVEELQKQMAELNSKLEYQKSEAEKAFQARDEAKKALKAKEDAELEKSGEIQKLYEGAKAKATELESEVERLKPLEAKIAEIEKVRKSELLEQIDDEAVRKEWEDSGIETITKFVSTLKKLKPKGGNDNGSSGKGKGEFKGTWDEAAKIPGKLAEIQEHNPSLYTELKAKKGYK